MFKLIVTFIYIFFIFKFFFFEKSLFLSFKF